MEGSNSAHAEQETMDCEASVDVDSLWKSFVQFFNSGIEKFIASKIAKHWKNHLPWVKSTLKKLIRKKINTSESKTKLTNLEIFNITSPSGVKFEEGFASYWTYVISIFSDGDREEQPVLGKRFWSFIKNSRTDKMGMPTLKCGNSVLPDASLHCA